MPHRLRERGIKPRKVGKREWKEYRERLGRQLQEDPAYISGFRRARPETVKSVLVLLSGSLTKEQFTRLMPRYRWLSPDEKSQLIEDTQQAVVLGLDAALWAARSHRTFTLNTLFEALAAAFSSHYRASTARVARDMSEEKVKACCRDLLLNGIQMRFLWRLLVGDWSKIDGANPLYWVTRLGLAGYRVKVRKGSSVLKGVLRRLRHDFVHTRGLQIWIASKKMAPREDRQEVCADVPYNAVTLGPHSHELLGRQENVELILDISAFKRDYVTLDRRAPELKANMAEDLGIDADLSNRPRFWYARGKGGASIAKPIWSERDLHVFCRGLEEGLHLKPDKTLLPHAQKLVKEDPEKWQRHRRRYLTWQRKQRRHSRQFRPSVERLAVAQLQTAKWRRGVHLKLGAYERVLQQLRQWEPLHDEFAKYTGEEFIRSRFCRTLNRRYQPIHFGPMFVSAKRATPESEAPQLGSERVWASYRHRWFKANDPTTNETLPLVGYDISSSQTQILAHFLGSQSLRGLTKDVLAERAWKQVFEGSDLYTGPGDESLRELVKVLWMRVLYGSPIYQVVVDQHEDYETFGPGWRVDEEEGSVKVAESFLTNQPEYEELKRFLDMCYRLAEVAYAKDCCRGLVLTDPFDGAEVRWNPVQRVDVAVSIYGQKLILGLPGAERGKKRLPKRPIPKRNYEPGIPNKNGNYPVDPEALSKMVAPCLVHMLDAFFSSLVMEKLAARGVLTFVGIHDCWLVPERVTLKGEQGQGRALLDDAIREAAKDWYAGLGVVYQDLLGYFDTGDPYRGFLEAIEANWKRQAGDGYVPEFLKKPSPPPLATG